VVIRYNGADSEITLGGGSVILGVDGSENMTFRDGFNTSEVTLTQLLEDDDQVDTVVAEGETFTVKEDHQHIIYRELIVDGDYVVDGEGVIFGGDDSEEEVSVAVGDLESGTLAELNAVITDATLDDSSDPRTPSAHASSHHSGGSDALDHGLFAGLGDDDHAQYLKADGARGLSADWDAGSHNIKAETLESDVATGTAPLTVASTTKVSNLNADKLDDQEGSYYLSKLNHTNLHPINAQTGTSYTLQDSDNGKLVTLDNSSAITLTVPSGLSSDFACAILQKGTGKVTITEGSGVTVNNFGDDSTTEGQWALASLTHLGSDVYFSQGRLKN